MVSGSQLPQQQQEAATADPDSPADTTTPHTAPREDDIEYKTVDMVLLYGGMDTEGEIFDDCLVYLVS